MKKLVSILLVVVTLLGLMIPLMASAESAEGHDVMWVVCANGKRLNVRYLPDTNSRLLYRVDNGSKLTVLHDEVVPEGWAMVRQGDKEVGYVMTQFLQAKRPYKYDLRERDDDFRSVNPYIVVAVARGKNTDESVGLRTIPTKQAKMLRRVMAGDELEVLQVGKTWSFVFDPISNMQGYVANDYIVRK